MYNALPAIEAVTPMRWSLCILIVLTPDSSWQWFSLGAPNSICVFDVYFCLYSFHKSFICLNWLFIWKTDFTERGDREIFLPLLDLSQMTTSKSIWNQRPRTSFRSSHGWRGPEMWVILHCPPSPKVGSWKCFFEWEPIWDAGTDLAYNARLPAWHFTAFKISAYFVILVMS